MTTGLIFRETLYSRRGLEVKKIVWTSQESALYCSKHGCGEQEISLLTVPTAISTRNINIAMHLKCAECRGRIHETVIARRVTQVVSHPANRAPDVGCVLTTARLPDQHGACRMGEDIS